MYDRYNVMIWLAGNEFVVHSWQIQCTLPNLNDSDVILVVQFDSDSKCGIYFKLGKKLICKKLSYGKKAV